MMDFIGTPAMTDDDLQRLLARARRIGRIGDAEQKAAAAELLPNVEALVAARRSLREDMEQARLAAARKRLH